MDENDVREFDGPLTVVKSSGLDDWYVIEKAEHGREFGMEKMDMEGTTVHALTYTGRISNADIEGTASEMMGIARAIRRKDTENYKRCGVDARAERVLLYSPRNSSWDASVPYDRALELADAIDRVCGK